MIDIGIGDWVLARSDSFKLLMTKVRDHLINTQVSFNKVKAKHRDIDNNLEDHESRIKKLERVLNALNEVPDVRLKKKRNED